MQGSSPLRGSLRCPSDRVSTLVAMPETPFTHRSARARHRPAARRPVARGRRHQRVVARGRRRVHARRLRQGLLRRADRGGARLALRRSRLPRPGRGVARRRLTRTRRRLMPQAQPFSETRLDWPRGTFDAQPRAARRRARRSPACSRSSCSTRRSRATRRRRSRRASSPGTAGKLSVTGKVVGPVTGDSHSAGGLRFTLRDIKAEPAGPRPSPVVYHGTRARPLQGRPRRQRERDSSRAARFVANEHDDEVPEQVHRRSRR